MTRSAGIELQARTRHGHPRCGAPSSARHGDSLPAAVRMFPHRSPNPRERALTLAAELSAHKTELNPHEAGEATSRLRTDQPVSFRARARAQARQLAKAELSRRPRSAVLIALRYRHGLIWRTRSRRSALPSWPVPCASIPRGMGCYARDHVRERLSYRCGNRLIRGCGRGIDGHAEHGSGSVSFWRPQVSHSAGPWPLVLGWSGDGVTRLVTR
jgi:hypothetical protein